MKMTYLMMRLEWKVFISSKPCRLAVIPMQEFIKYTFDKLLFFSFSSKIAISYKVKNVQVTIIITPVKNGEIPEVII